jgi:hypothetical protein
MRYSLILIALFSLNALALQQIDYACIADCSANGYQYNYCQARCTYETAPQNNNSGNQGYQFAPPMKQTDYKCVNDCTARGYMYNYCSSACSF